MIGYLDGTGLRDCCCCQQNILDQHRAQLLMGLQQHLVNLRIDTSASQCKRGRMELYNGCNIALHPCVAARDIDMSHCWSIEAVLLRQATRHVSAVNAQIVLHLHQLQRSSSSGILWRLRCYDADFVAQAAERRQHITLHLL